MEKIVSTRKECKVEGVNMIKQVVWNSQRSNKKR